MKGCSPKTQAAPTGSAGSSATFQLATLVGCFGSYASAPPLQPFDGRVGLLRAAGLDVGQATPSIAHQQQVNALALRHISG